MRGKFFIAMKVRRLPSRNFARFPWSRKEFRGASYDFVRITFYPSLLLCRICLSLSAFSNNVRYDFVYSAPLSFFFEISGYLKPIARIDHNQIINSFSEKIIFSHSYFFEFSQIVYFQCYNVWGEFYVKYIESPLVTICYIKSPCELLILVCHTTKRWWSIDLWLLKFLRLCNVS